MDEKPAALTCSTARRRKQALHEAVQQAAEACSTIGSAAVGKQYNHGIQHYVLTSGS
jgi:hypothetical protein